MPLDKLTCLRLAEAAFLSSLSSSSCIGSLDAAVRLQPRKLHLIITWSAKLIHHRRLHYSRKENSWGNESWQLATLQKKMARLLAQSSNNIRTFLPAFWLKKNVSEAFRRSTVRPNSGSSSSTTMLNYSSIFWQEPFCHVLGRVFLWLFQSGLAMI